MRVRAFTQDDAHIYCMPDQIEQEVITIIKMTYAMLNKFGFNDIDVTISTKPENAMGSEELWEKATNALKDALDTMHKIHSLFLKAKAHFMGQK